MTITEKINRLFDYAVAHPEGFTYLDVKQDIGWQRTEFFKVANRLRSVLGGDQINLICEPAMSGAPWVYQLTGKMEGAKWWQDNRLGDAETRLETIRNTAKSIVGATDGRTSEGKRARLIDRQLTRLLEDLAILRGEL